MWRAIRPWLFPVWCVGCGAGEVALCASCVAGERPIDVWAGSVPVLAATAYAGPIRAALLAMKRGERAPLDPLAGLVAAHLPPGAILTPAVTTRRRAAERGFDQARELAQRASRACGGSIADVLVKRGGPQRGGSRAQRLAASGRFAVRPGAALPWATILIDDVLTTGATLRDAAAALEAAGVAVAGAVVVAHAPRETSAAGRESQRA